MNKSKNIPFPPPPLEVVHYDLSDITGYSDPKLEFEAWREYSEAHPETTRGLNLDLGFFVSRIAAQHAQDVADVMVILADIQGAYSSEKALLPLLDELIRDYGEDDGEFGPVNAARHRPPSVVPNTLVGKIEVLLHMGFEDIVDEVLDAGV